MIRIEALTKKYGGLTAVDNLTLTVRPGEIYGFLGPNGAGKTTTIKTIVGLLRPTAGDIWVDGHHVVKEADAAKRASGYIPDTPQPYDRLTGREFLLTMGALYGVEPGLRAERVARALELFELEPWANELTESYSHGMKQKLVISAALIHEPRVIVADEPLVGLDPRSARRLKELFQALAAGGRTVILATHILEIAEKLCHRVGIMAHGRLVAEGTVGELRELVKAPGSNLEELFLALTAEGGADAEALGEMRNEECEMRNAK